MSIPLKRRIVRAALLVAAAAPVIGMGVGTASAVEPPRATDLSGLSGLDNAAVDHALRGASQHVNQLARRAAGPTVSEALPAVGKVANHAGRAVTPIAKRLAHDTGSTTESLLGRAARTVQGRGGLPEEQIAKALSFGG